jgi:protease I
VADRQTDDFVASLQTDIRNAVGNWDNPEVIVDTERFPLVTSRNPDDLPAFNREMVAAFSS